MSTDCPICLKKVFSVSSDKTICCNNFCHFECYRVNESCPICSASLNFKHRIFGKRYFSYCNTECKQAPRDKDDHLTLYFTSKQIVVTDLVKYVRECLKTGWFTIIFNNLPVTYQEIVNIDKEFQVNIFLPDFCKRCEQKNVRTVEALYY